MKKTTYALIGTGIVGERIINQILQHEASEIVALFDENKERLHKIAAQYTLPIVESIEALIDMRPDWVYIGTPPVSHAPIARKIAQHGLNILCEKPLAHDVKDGEMMVEAAREANIKTAMHFPLMYSPAVQRIKEALKNGELGEVVRVELHTYFPEWPRKWQQNPWIASREQGGFVREVFPHYLQLTQHLFGNLHIVSHDIVYPSDISLCETAVSALARTTDGLPVLLNGVSRIGQEELLTFKIFGTEKVMTLRNWSELWVSEAYEGAVAVQVTTAPPSLLDACQMSLENKEATIVTFEEGLGVQRLVAALLIE